METTDNTADAEKDLQDEGSSGLSGVYVKELLKSCISNPDKTCVVNSAESKILLAGSHIKMEKVERWISCNAPSTITKEGDCEFWIHIVGSKGRNFESEEDVAGLVESWEKFLKSDRTVNYENIKELACKYKVLSGKWLFFCTSGGKVDHLWSLVVKGIVGDSSWPCVSAKVSAYDTSEENYRHVVCIYNDDFTDLHQVIMAEQAIRNMGLKCELLYKPDAYTYLGVYRHNPWNLRPVIMKSVFDLKLGKSVIQSFVPS